jgi:hypothetical protein
VSERLVAARAVLVPSLNVTVPPFTVLLVTEAVNVTRLLAPDVNEGFRFERRGVGRGGTGRASKRCGEGRGRHGEGKIIATTRNPPPLKELPSFIPKYTVYT